ncbi:MAG TPA: YqiA/YcfP family alpha/beta fold hydrolase [Thermoanaerobaculia bacterium]|nr:YqiA/YcfP family alpha/beta fold hydrolase [Thermoanaerobaculia bacterium]
MNVLYFHGFASSPASGKITALRPLLAPHGIELDTPDLNAPSFEELDFEAIVARALDTAARNPPGAIVGSSLGAIIALEVARRGLEMPLVLIAPAVGIAERWIEKLPAGDPIMVFNHARNADAPIHRAFFEQMSRVDADRLPPRQRVIAIMGRRDESVPFARVEQTWNHWEAAGLAPGSKLIVIDEGDHGLVAWSPIIADAIREAVA